jgi:peptidoglycan biosynthesis protein MviN/MurJ (putative lipid II flippase)
VPILAAGFPPEKMQEAINLAGLLFPSSFLFPLRHFNQLSSMLMAAFFCPLWPQLSSTSGWFGGALFLSKAFNPPILGLVVGTLAGGAGMVLLLIPAFRRNLGPKTQAPLIHPDLGKWASAFSPALLG